MFKPISSPGSKAGAMLVGGAGPLEALLDLKVKTSHTHTLLSVDAKHN